MNAEDDESDDVSEYEFVLNLRRLQRQMPTSGHQKVKREELPVPEVEFAGVNTDDDAGGGDDVVDGCDEYDQMVSGWHGPDRTTSVAMASSASAAIDAQPRSAPCDGGYEAHVRAALLAALQAKTHELDQEMLHKRATI